MASAEDAIRPPDQGPPAPSLERTRPEPINANEEEDTSERPVAPEVEWIPLLSLVGQHFSSTWGERSYEFASYLYLIVLFPSTLIPASLLGLLVTATGISFSGYVGGLVDRYKRLRFVRTAIIVQKLLQASSYALFLVLFLPLHDGASTAFGASTSSTELSGHHRLVYFILALIIMISSLLGLATAGLNVSIQRDWVVTISAGSSTILTRLNTYLRRVDLLCKLLAPLFVSLLTTAISYPASVVIMMGIAAATLAFELVWIAVVWNRFGVLAVEEGETRSAEHISASEVPGSAGRRLVTRVKEGLKQQGKDLREFAGLPVFLSSLAISLAYLTTLSFDGIMISYLKAERSFSDAFIAGMRGVCVVTGLFGTIVMPVLERRIGLTRAGAWSLWSEILCLVPVVLSLYIGLSHTISNGPAWNAVLLFGGMALSRIGLWSFDLVQLQILQETLANHSRRNAMTALQLSLQNAFDMTKYVLVLGLNRPEQFKWTALVSWIAVFTGGVVYSVYVYRVRGHLTHWVWLGGKAGHEDEQNEVSGVEGAGFDGGHGMRIRRAHTQQPSGL